MQIDMIDKLITIGIVLLILSLITEKITQFIRKYFRHASELRLLKFFFRNPPTAQTKDKEVMYVSISVGMLVAWASNASIFTLFKAQDPTSILFINIIGGSFDEVKAIGIILTGVFLSLGSKIFHDLLEMLFQIKRLKQKATDEKTYQMHKLEELNEYIATADGIMIEKAIKKHERFLKSIPGNPRIYHGTKEINGRQKAAIVIHFEYEKKVDFQIPASLSYFLSSGKSIDIPVEVIANVKIPTMQAKPGVKILNTTGDGEIGAYGCLVHDNSDEFILTCSHVALSGTDKNPNGYVNFENELILRSLGFGPSRVIGELYYCKLDKKNDTALIKTLRSSNCNNVNSFSIEKERKIIPDEDTGAELFFKSCVSGRIQNGFIHVACSISTQKFNYKEKIIEFDNMIIIGQRQGNRWCPISKPGDSGSVLIDRNNHAVGLLIGANDHFTYALPILPILNEVNVTIV